MDVDMQRGMVVMQLTLLLVLYCVVLSVLVKLPVFSGIGV